MERSEDPISERIVRRAGAPGLVDVLTTLAPTELQSLLLDVARRRAAALEPADVLRRYETDPLVRPSAAEPRRVRELEDLALSLLPAGFELVELSPVCPFGTSSVLGSLSQDWMVATMRNGEVVSDSTAVLALECARQRRGADRRTSLELAAATRLVRAQALRDPAHVPHFSLLGLCTAARDAGSFRTELVGAARHLDFYLHFLEAARRVVPRLGRLAVTVTDLDGRRGAQLEHDLLEPLALRFPEVGFRLAPELEHRRAYYTGLCFGVEAESGSAGTTGIVDGGFTDWTQRLLSDRKERLLTSGTGLELLALAFGD